MFPDGCTGDDIPQRYGFLVYDENKKAVSTYPRMSMCDGNAMQLKGLKKGDYQIRVVNFDGSAEGHDRVWKMRAFGQKKNLRFAS
jgi:hypothetical protein